MTPQKVFAESVHLWIIPLFLVLLKVLFDLLPLFVFLLGMVLAIGAYFVLENIKTKQIEKKAEELVVSADSFLEELNNEEKLNKEKELKKKVRMLYCTFLILKGFYTDGQRTTEGRKIQNGKFEV